MERLLLRRVTDGGYDSGVCTTKILFQQSETEAAIGAGDEDIVRHIGFFGIRQVVWKLKGLKDVVINVVQCGCCVGLSSDNLMYAIPYVVRSNAATRWICE